MAFAEDYKLGQQIKLILSLKGRIINETAITCPVKITRTRTSMTHAELKIEDKIKCLFTLACKPNLS